MAKASTGVGKVYYAIMNADGTYGTVKELGKLIEVSVKHNMNQSSASAGDSTYLQTTEYGGSDISISIYDIPQSASVDLYGHKLGTAGDVILSSKDAVPYIALMMEQNGKSNSTNVVDYVTLYKGQLQEPERKGKTKEQGKTEYQAYQIAGSFSDLDNGVYCDVVSSDSPDFNATTWASIWGKTVPVATVKTTTTATK